jgi:hypothetical protein
MQSFSVPLLNTTPPDRYSNSNRNILGFGGNEPIRDSTRDIA